MRREVLAEFLLGSLDERDHMEGLPLRKGDIIRGCRWILWVAQKWDRSRAAVKKVMNMYMTYNKHSHCQQSQVCLYRNIATCHMFRPFPLILVQVWLSEFKVHETSVLSVIEMLRN